MAGGTGSTARSRRRCCSATAVVLLPAHPDRRQDLTKQGNPAPRRRRRAARTSARGWICRRRRSRHHRPPWEPAAKVASDSTVSRSRSLSLRWWPGYGAAGARSGGGRRGRWRRGSAARGAGSAWDRSPWGARNGSARVHGGGTVRIRGRKSYVRLIWKGAGHGKKRNLFNSFFSWLCLIGIWILVTNMFFS